MTRVNDDNFHFWTNFKHKVVKAVPPRSELEHDVPICIFDTGLCGSVQRPRAE